MKFLLIALIAISGCRAASQSDAPDVDVDVNVPGEGEFKNTNGSVPSVSLEVASADFIENLNQWIVLMEERFQADSPLALHLVELAKRSQFVVEASKRSLSETMGNWQLVQGGMIELKKIYATANYANNDSYINFLYKELQDSYRPFERSVKQFQIDSLVAGTSH